MDFFSMAHDALPPLSHVGSDADRIAYAQVLATLSVSQELSRLNHGESKLSESVVDLARHFEPKAGNTNWN